MSETLTSEDPRTATALPPVDISSSDLSNLDLLRTIAVGLVFARHLLDVAHNPTNAIFYPQALGILGVLLFFVHTTLVLMMSMDRHGSLGKGFTWAAFSSFMVRRVFRIYPLSIITVLITFFVLFPLSLYPHTSPTIRQLVSNLLLTQNLTHSRSVIGPLWSLPLEVQMYLFLPFLYIAANRWGYRFLMLVVWPVSVVLGLITYRFHLNQQITAYAPCFIPGAIAFDLLRRRERRALPFWVLPAGIFVLAILYMAAVKRYSAIYVFGFPVCLALGLLLTHVKEIPPRFAKLKILFKTIAKYSYGFYLFHDIFISIVFYHCPWLPLAARLPVTLLLTGITSYIGYQLIEAPLIRVGSRVASSVDSRWHPARIS